MRLLGPPLVLLQTCTLLLVCFLAGDALGQEVRVEAPATTETSAIREAVRVELSAQQVAGSVTIHVDEARHTLRVVFAPREGAPLERTVPLPDGARARARAAAFLARNLTSNESAELLDALAARRKPPTKPATGEETEGAPAGAPATNEEAEPPAVGPPEPVVLPPPARRGPCDDPVDALPATFSLFSPLGLPSRPVDTAFTYSLLYGDLSAIRGAGLGTVLRVRCETKGAVVTLGGNILEERSAAAMLATGFNITSGRADGAALAAGLNLHLGPLRGVTASPVTIAPGGVEGAQIGLLNIGGSVSGTQVGVINIAGEVKGAQVGVLNIAKDTDAALGALLSISWAQRIRAFVWTSSITPLQVGVLFEGKRMYAGVSFGRVLQEILSQGEFYLGPEIGLHAYANPDTGVIWDFAVSSDSSVGLGSGRFVDLVRLGTRVGYRVAPRFAPYMYGGAALVTLAQPTDALLPLDDFTVKPEIGGGVVF